MAALARVMLFLVLCVGVTVSAAVDLQKRIVGGTKCERPYHVKLNGIFSKPPHKYGNTCGGSLISNKWILTAAHCARKPSLTLQSMSAYLSVDPETEVKITNPPVFYEDDNNKKHDIMLLEVKLPDTILSSIKPIQLPGAGECPDVGDKIILAGNGATEAGPDGSQKDEESPTLHCAEFDVISCDSYREYLKNTYGNSKNFDAEDHFCVHTSGKNTCPGDSGGGAEYKGKICGVHVRGRPDVCGEPSALLNICNENYLSWIQKTIKN